MLKSLKRPFFFLEDGLLTILIELRLLQNCHGDKANTALMSRHISSNGNKITAGERLISSRKYTSATHTLTRTQRNVASALAILFTCLASRTEGEIRH